MLVTRNINGVECDVDIQSADTIFFEEDVAEAMEKGEISNISRFFYDQKGQLLPLNLLLELTNGCNFSCLFCYIKNKKPFWRSFEEIKKDLEYLIGKGLLFCTLTGGECLTHPDFEEIYLFLKQSGVLVSIFTNGSLLTDSIFEMFKQYPPQNIEITVYGIDEVQFFVATDQRKILPDVVLSNILRLKSEGFKVTCKTPINKVTQNQFFKIKGWMEEHKVDYYFSDALFNTYDGVSTEQYSVDDPEIVSFVNARERDITEFNTTEKAEQRTYFDCKAGRHSIYISNYGVLMPCQASYGLESFMFDINILGIEQALKALTKLIEGYKGKPIKYCAGCKKHKGCTECLITQLKQKDVFTYMQEHCNAMNPEKI
jgi:MoaA/NifB/PqqE/SkfB family radical SAM enzyme